MTVFWEKFVKVWKILKILLKIFEVLKTIAKVFKK